MPGDKPNYNECLLHAETAELFNKNKFDSLIFKQSNKVFTSFLRKQRRNFQNLHLQHGWFNFKLSIAKF